MFVHVQCVPIQSWFPKIWNQSWFRMLSPASQTRKSSDSKQMHMGSRLQRTMFQSRLKLHGNSVPRPLSLKKIQHRHRMFHHLQVIRHFIYPFVTVLAAAASISGVVITGLQEQGGHRDFQMRDFASLQLIGLQKCYGCLPNI